MNEVVEGRQQFDDELAGLLQIAQYDERQSRLMYLMEFMKHGNFNVSLLCVLKLFMKRFLGQSSVVFWHTFSI